MARPGLHAKADAAAKAVLKAALSCAKANPARLAANVLNAENAQSVLLAIVPHAKVAATAAVKPRPS